MTNNAIKKKKKPQLQQKKPILKAELKNVDSLVWFALAIVLMTTFAIYFKAISFDFLFTWDDNLYVSKNNDIRELGWQNIKLFFSKNYLSNYHPLTMLTYALDYKSGAGKASFFHFSNMLLHLLNTCLVFVLIRKISPQNAVVAFITAAFFAVHPMHVESVAWIAERKDVLYTFFFLLSLIMYIIYLKFGKIRYLILVFLFFLLSCLSKSAAVVLPLLLFLFDYYTGRKFKWKMVLEKTPFLVLSLVFGIMAINSQKGSIQDMAPHMSVMAHISMVCFSFISYLFKAFIPVNLSAIYPYPMELESSGSLPALYYLSIIGVGIVLYFVWYTRRWGKDVIFGLLFFITTIILVLQLIPVGAASMADRYTYTPYIGVFFIIGQLYAYLTLHVKYKKHAKYLLIALVLGFIDFSTLSYGRIEQWKDDDTLFSDVINKYPGCPISYRNRGSYFLNLANNNDIKNEIFTKKALADFESALKFSFSTKSKVSAYYNLGTTKLALNNNSEALKDFDKVVSLDSAYVGVYLNRGNARVALGDYKGGLSDLDMAVKKMPDDPIALCNRAHAKAGLGDAAGAISDLDKAIKIKPDYTDAYNNRGIIKDDLKDFAGALSDYNKVIELNPNIAATYNNRGVTKLNLGEIDGACTDFSKAVQLGYGPAEDLKNKYCH